MDIFIFISIVLLVVISCILVWINLPGSFLFLFFIFLYALYDDFEIITQNILLLALVVFILLELLEFLLSLLTIKMYGGNNSSAWLSIVGGIAGAIFGSFIIPIIGSVLGLIFGSYFITYYNEKNIGKTHEEAKKIAGSSTLGYIFSKGLKSATILIFALNILK
tara:strand:+ start:5154 stop:5645 length:492 start_codon:yes stop_codon:yes gene_type:complete